MGGRSSGWSTYRAPTAQTLRPLQRPWTPFAGPLRPLPKHPQRACRVRILPSFTGNAHTCCTVEHVNAVTLRFTRGSGAIRLYSCEVRGPTDLGHRCANDLTGSIALRLRFAARSCRSVAAADLRALFSQGRGGGRAKQVGRPAAHITMRRVWCHNLQQLVSC